MVVVVAGTVTVFREKLTRLSDASREKQMGPNKKKEDAGLVFTIPS